MLGPANSDPDFINIIVADGDDESWVYGYDPKTKSFRHFPYNENPTKVLNIISLKYYLSSTYTFDRRGKKKVQGRLMQARYI